MKAYKAQENKGDHIARKQQIMSKKTIVAFLALRGCNIT